MTTPDGQDVVARNVAQWGVERPDLDVSPMLVISRLHRLATLTDEGLRQVFAPAGLGDGEFDVLATLRRAGEPYALSPTELAGRTMVTSGATSKRIDRLEARGLVERQTSTDDRRGRLISLTDQGRNLVDRLLVLHLANEERLLEGLSTDDRDQLAALLSRWLLALEGPAS